MQTTTNRRQLILTLGSALAVAATSGCATTGAAPASAARPLSPGDDRAALLQRVQAYWAAVRVNDLVAAWPFEDISKDSLWTLQSYLNRGGGLVYDNVEVREVRQLEGDHAVVDVLTQYSVPLLRVNGQQGVVADEWRRIDGMWYHIRPRSSLLHKLP